MIRIESESGGGEDFVAELMGQTEERAEMAVFDAIQHLRTKAIEKVSGQRSGRTYLVPGQRSATYQASNPGEPPAVATGKLRQNINAEGPNNDGSEISGKVGVDLRVVPYARRLEYGGVHVQAKDQVFPTADGFRRVRAGTVIRVAPRPWLRPTFDQERAAVERMMQRRLDRG